MRGGEKRIVGSRVECACRRFVSANPVRLDRLEIEAAVLPTSLERLKKSWVERQLEGF